MSSAAPGSHFILQERCDAEGFITFSPHPFGREWLIYNSIPCAPVQSLCWDKNIARCGQAINYLILIHSSGRFASLPLLCWERAFAPSFLPSNFNKTSTPLASIWWKIVVGRKVEAEGVSHSQIGRWSSPYTDRHTASWRGFGGRTKVPGDLCKTVASFHASLHRNWNLKPWTSGSSSPVGGRSISFLMGMGMNVNLVQTRTFCKLSFDGHGFKQDGVWKCSANFGFFSKNCLNSFGDLAFSCPNGVLAQNMLWEKLRTYAERDQPFGRYSYCVSWSSRKYQDQLLRRGTLR